MGSTMPPSWLQHNREPASGPVGAEEQGPAAVMVMWAQACGGVCARRPIFRP